MYRCMSIHHYHPLTIQPDTKSQCTKYGSKFLLTCNLSLSVGDHVVTHHFKKRNVKRLT